MSEAGMQALVARRELRRKAWDVSVTILAGIFRRNGRTSGSARDKQLKST
jgi:hypothetical protein